MKFLILVMPLVLVIVYETFGQAPRTISHQGLLTDTSGTPVIDDVRSMTFKFYNSKSGSTSLWTETQNVATEGGVFNAILGSVNPIIGVDFDQEVWLGVKVGSDAEMGPRTKLTSVPTALALVMPYRDTLRIQTSDLGTDGSETANEDLIVQANDAFVGLYSNNGGAAGSGIQLGEIVGGSLTNKWTIYRKTTGAGGHLRLSYGASPNYASNPTVVEISTSGTIDAEGDFIASGDFRYAADRIHHYQRPVASFGIDDNEESPLGNASFHWFRENGHIRMSGIPVDVRAGFSAPVDLPNGATILSFTLYYYDNEVNGNMQFDYTLKRRELLGSGTVGLGTLAVSTSGSSTDIQDDTIDTSASLYKVVNNQDYMYWVEVGLTRLEQLGLAGLRFYGMSIEYKTSGVGH